ncbi:MAG TPA: hypothetical protein PLR76_09375 [Hyphomonas sp.]|nr:hypothetical protein [Hyphomonas sp.]
MNTNRASAAVLAVCVTLAACAAAPERACATDIIVASAEVTTSYGHDYRVETYYRSPKEAAARFLNEAPALLVVEGPFTWVSQGGSAEPGSARERRFALGHQFQALLDRFDDIVTDVEPIDHVLFDGRAAGGRKGHFPGGGTVTVVTDEAGHPAGLIMDLPDEKLMTIRYSDWRTDAEGHPLAYTVSLEQDGNRFDYRYNDITVGRGDQSDFERRYPAPDIAEIRDYRAARPVCR